MTEEPLRVVELEGLQAHGPPGRGEEGEADPWGSGKPTAPTERAQSWGTAQLWGADPHRQLKEKLQGWHQVRQGHAAGTAVPPGSLLTAPGSPQGTGLSPDQTQTHLLLGKLLGPLHAGVVGLRLQVDVQHHAQALQLVGEELVAWFGPPQLLVVHIDLALHGLAEGTGQSRLGSLFCPPRTCCIQQVSWACPATSSAQRHGLLWARNRWEHSPKNSGSPNSSTTTPGYPNVVIVAAGPLSFPVQAQAEDGRQRGVTRVQDYGSLELG